MIRKIREAMEEREEGFTLIELLVVVIIIGILAAIAIPVFLNQREKAFRSAVKGDLRNVATQLESYYTDNFDYSGYDPAASYSFSEGVVYDPNNASTIGTNSYCVDATHTGLASTSG
ncbi:MAG: prepilin-type N-terminal cleavage/methylation domain-containing protein, partial [Nitriliruptorales bacterium]|nr:prepilin-type N-terminal cleavage/methylation domain-containing protein [Nitriliruptorales bacterium]